MSYERTLRMELGTQSWQLLSAKLGAFQLELGAFQLELGAVFTEIKRGVDDF
jgi:hypothetical protein